MFPIKYISIATRHPRSMLAGIRLLMSNHETGLQRHQLDSIIRNRFRSLPSDTTRQNFPRVSLLHVDGQDYYLRLYPIPMVDKAARHLWACNLREKYEISVPKVQQTCFTSVAGRKCIAVLEENLGGTQIGHRMWTKPLAERFAAELAKWHAIQEPHYRPVSGLLVRANAATYAQKLNRKNQPDREPTAEQTELIGLGRELLKDSELFFPLRISHGDINPHNLIKRQDGKVAWIDMDLVSLRPVWQDLAMVICKMMLPQTPAVVDAFEKTYFKYHPNLLEHWKAVRLRWLVLQNVIQGVAWLSSDRGRRWGASNTTAETYRPYEWAQRSFARAAGALELSKTNKNLGEVVKCIHAAYFQLPSSNEETLANLR